MNETLLKYLSPQIDNYIFEDNKKEPAFDKEYRAEERATLEALVADEVFKSTAARISDFGARRNGGGIIDEVAAVALRFTSESWSWA